MAGKTGKGKLAGRLLRIKLNVSLQYETLDNSKTLPKQIKLKGGETICMP
jgi:hypothetical protein